MNNSASKEFELEIDYALKTSKLLILVFTKADELHSEWVKKEWKEFLKSDKSIIPVFMNLPVGDMAKVPDDIRCLQGFDRKRQINREGEKENRAELFQEYHPAR